MATTTSILSCANCGKDEEEICHLKTCVACKEVKYCNRDCQIAHRPHHKKACKKRVVELHEMALFKEVEPEECPICMLPLPPHIDESPSIFMSCCGKTICKGCIHAMRESEGKDLCAFCRTPTPSSGEEHVKLLNKLMDKGNAEAFKQLAGLYAQGRMGMPQDYQKANELLLKAGELGCADGYHNLGNSYNQGLGVEIDKKKAKYYKELAAKKGNVYARKNVGYEEWEAGNYNRAMKHWIIAARAGDETSLNVVKKGYIRAGWGL